MSKNWRCKEQKVTSTEVESVTYLRIKDKKEVINIMTTYNSDYKKNIDVIIKEIEACENKEIIIGGDFNIRRENWKEQTRR